MNKEKRIVPKLRFPEFEKDKEWEIRPFSTFIKLYRGSSPRPIREYLTQNKDGVNWIKIGDASSVSDFIIREVQEKITNEGAKKSRAVKRGELILANSMSYGNTYQLALDGYIYDGWFVLREYNNIYNKQFLLHLLNSNYMQKQYKKFAAGGIVQNISSEIVYSTLLPKTSIKEQKKIANCLSSLDDLINAHNDNLEALKGHKKGLLQNLFPQKGQKVPNYRFPEFKKDGDWVEKQLIATADKNIKWSFTGGPFGSNLKASDYTIKGVRIIQLQNIGDGEFIDDSKIYTSVEKADELLSCNIYAGDIILSKMGDPVGRACIIPEKLERCVMASDGIRLAVDEKEYSKYFIYSLINSHLIRNAIRKKSTGSTRKRIGLNDLKEVKLLLPKNKQEQKKIGSCISAVDALITKQKEKIEQLQQHKKGLMQGLFPKIEN